MADLRSPPSEGEFPPDSNPHKAFKHQVKTNNDREKRIKPLYPFTQETSHFSKEQLMNPGLFEEYQQPGLSSEGTWKTSSRPIKQEDSLIKKFDSPEDDDTGVITSAANVDRTIRHPLETLSLRSDVAGFVSGGDSQFKRSVEALAIDERTNHQRALKQRKTTRHISSASQPLFDKLGSPYDASDLAPGSRLSPPAQRSYSNLRSSRGNQILPHRQKSGTQKLLASRDITNSTNLRKVGQSLSDPVHAQADVGGASSTFDSGRPSRRNSNTSDTVPKPPHTSIVAQPDSKPMPEKQLAAEIKAIYSGLVLVESKCIAVDTAESTRLKDIRAGKKPRPTLANKQNHWPAIISLHRALLQEHHDFFLASQHPAASPPLRQLAEKYSMPERMWKHGIRSPLELFRFELPYSKEFMIAFIILSYQMICLLYETVSSFEDTWVECLGDLARYRFAIEDEDPKDREIWSNVSRAWYTIASAKQPKVGRLYHHQAILARTNPLKQLCFYARALNATQLFVNARESIVTLFDPILLRLNIPGSNKISIDSHFIRLQAMIFTGRELDTHYETTRSNFLSGLPDMINDSGSMFKTYGEYMGNVIIADLFRWGAQNDSLRKLFLKDSTQLNKPNSHFVSATPASRAHLQKEWELTFGVLEVILDRPSDENILPLLLILTTFFAVMVVRGGINHIDEKFPIDALAKCGNTFIESDSIISNQDSDIIILETMYGQIWTESLIPASTLSRTIDLDDISETSEYPDSNLLKRMIVTMLRKMASAPLSERSDHKRWILYDKTGCRFKTDPYSHKMTQKLHEREHNTSEVTVWDEDPYLEYSQSYMIP